MEKYIFSGLTIELTRKCNMKCAHCMRGDAQDISMSRETIDRLIDSVDVCTLVSITGGEPMLEMDNLLYLLHLITKKWKCVTISFVTNGSILDKRLVDAFENFCKVDPNRLVAFCISRDKYHTAGAYETAWNFYEPLVNEANGRISPTDGNGIVLSYHDVADNVLIYSGRAVNTVNKSRGKFRYAENLIAPDSCLHRLRIKNGCVFCGVNISVDGGVSLSGLNCSYQDIDANTVGYLSDNTLTHIIKMFNSENLLLCSESLFFDAESSARFLKNDIKIEDYLRIVSYAELCRVILKIRYAVQKMYGNLAAEDIIRGIQMPTSENEGHVVLALLATISPYQDVSKALENVDKQTRELVKATWRNLPKTTRDACTTVIRALAYLVDPDCIDHFIRLHSADIQKLVNLSQQYKTYGITPSNDTVFACNEEGNIFSNQYV